MTRVTMALAIAAASALGACDQGLTRVRVAYDGFSMTSAPLYYATKEGIFRRFGLDLSPFHVEGGSMLTQALVGGSIDIAQNGYTPAASAAVQGADVVFIGGISNKLPYQLVAKTEIADAQQLKGAMIAISRYGSSTEKAADFALEHLGLRRDDVRILQFGGAATRMAAAMSGQIDATMEQQPDTAELARHGFHVLVDVTDIAGDYPNTSYVTSRAYLGEHRDLVKRFLMAMATAVSEYRRNPELAIRHTSEFLGVEDPANARAAYEAYVDIYPSDLRPSLNGLSLVLEEISTNEPKAAAFTPGQLVDTSLLDELEREGFFERLR